MHNSISAKSSIPSNETGAPARPISKGRVGLMVAGSMISGLVVSLALVLGPFEGAQEHVIMGTALLGCSRAGGAYGPRWRQPPDF